MKCNVTVTHSMHKLETPSAAVPRAAKEYVQTSALPQVYPGSACPYRSLPGVCLSFAYRLLVKRVVSPLSLAKTDMHIFFTESVTFRRIIY